MLPFPQKLTCGGHVDRDTLLLMHPSACRMFAGAGSDAARRTGGALTVVTHPVVAHDDASYPVTMYSRTN
jgi:hypothetical protein